jgi:TM2 domain-containing membrane protein YozV
MRPAVKAFLLSAFVFPGLGQLYKRDRAKGVLLILTANLLLGLVALVGVMLFAGEVEDLTGPVTVALLQAAVLRVLTRPLFLSPFALFVALWAYGAVDALLASLPVREEP